jgi:hypothetical protein
VPLGLFAARRMAPHDVLFLHRDPRWFELYRERFGGHFNRGKDTRSAAARPVPHGVRPARAQRLSSDTRDPFQGR